MPIKQRIGRIAPRWIVRGYRRLATAWEFWRDYRDYSTSSAWDRGSSGSSDRRDDRESLTSRITIAYHGLEKGASFPNPRRPYGAARRAELEQLLQLSSADRGLRETASHARVAIEALDTFNASGVISDIVTPLSDWAGQTWDGPEIERFVNSRHSVRNFDPNRRLEVDLLERVVRLAGKTPSVCNRRSYRAHYYDDRGDIDRALSFQNGNNGFGHTVPGLIVVTQRRSAFVGAGERNQRWVDGGLFAMTLVWLLHAHGVGSCFLNWSQTNAQSDKLRKVAGIDRSEDIVVMVAVGYPANDHRVARSPQRPLEDILIRHAGGPS